MKKPVLHTEAAYFIAIITLAVSVAFAEKADLGVSTIVAPAYILYRWLAARGSAISYGTVEYCFQGVLLIVMMLFVHRFRVSYLLSFVTAIFYGFVLDGCMALVAPLPVDFLWQRVLWFAIGLVLCGAGVSMVMHTYLPPEVYDLFSREGSAYLRVNVGRFITVYNCIFCAIGLVMSFVCFGFGQFVGVSWGTLVCALFTGALVNLFTRVFERIWTFKDGLPWRPFFMDVE